MTRPEKAHVTHANHYANASSRYNQALRTISPVMMMITVITQIRQNLKQAAHHRAAKKFDLEQQEKSTALGKIRGLRAVVSFENAPELSRDLYAFYTRLLRLLSSGGRATPIENRYILADQQLEALAAEWKRVAAESKNVPSAVPPSHTGKQLLNQVL
ncbi:flagellar protein FliS [Thalassospira sp.]|uniref:flagellar protein FliS n=1 Tax=Thalassospira sp. TaxID=1912094 RepID=UPI0027374CD3|nr:flagellar protein FliS [Thalassospira sp.]MDP2700351.1 flagellar protein FliS [Thalassospira sp.]